VGRVTSSSSSKRVKPPYFGSVPVDASGRAGAEAGGAGPGAGPRETASDMVEFSVERGMAGRAAKPMWAGLRGGSSLAVLRMRDALVVLRALEGTSQCWVEAMRRVIGRPP
jgi:hypothetical protein